MSKVQLYYVSMNLNYEQVNLYIHGDLTGEELADFETRLQEDETFAQAVDFYRDMERILFAKYKYEQEYADLVDLLTELREKYFPNDEIP